METPWVVQVQGKALAINWCSGPAWFLIGPFVVPLFRLLVPTEALQGPWACGETPRKANPLPL